MQSSMFCARNALKPSPIWFQPFMFLSARFKQISSRSRVPTQSILFTADMVVLIGYLRFNPADACILPHIERKELKPLGEDDIANFLKAFQAQQKLIADESWCNSENLVFTNNIGQHLTKPTVYRAFKVLTASIGRPDARFHDLRHP